MATDKAVVFPEDFLLGTGSSAYQVEGAWAADGKTPSIWDEFFNNGQRVKHDDYVCPHYSVFKEIQYGVEKATDQPILNTIKRKLVKIEDVFKGFQYFKKEKTPYELVSAPTYTKEDGGMIACDSYNKTDIDVKLLKDLGVQVYRFSLSWPRLLPNGDDKVSNEKGIEYYKNLIQKLLDNDIEPVVTIYHWDLPEALQKLGGWANTNIVRYFTNYCNFVFQTFGDKVTYWSTINEPRLVAGAYGGSKSAPALGDDYSGIADYMVIHNLLLAHAYAYKLYNDKYREKQQGEISLCLDAIWFFPADPDDEKDKEAAELAFQSFVGIFIQPLLTGDYPDAVVKSIIQTNEREKINIWRIIQFTENEKEILKGAYDFIAFNYYFSLYAKPMSQESFEDSSISLKTKDIGVDILGFQDTHDPEDTREGFRNLLNWFDEKLNHPKIFISENGFPEPAGEDRSLEKKQFHYDILNEVDQALKRKIKVFGYCVWSFMDSLEWSDGYKTKYGIYGVNFDDESRPRYKKEKIFTFFEQLFKTKTLPSPEVE
ncbi:lactase/phlorizin hydrolase-like [Adelges cooleyi]|uniref:lactase/phlorizin hydrolase-like n=1 Tax=Adelges cooleyi TaxID=133065 RepID=UPI00217F56E2|nr:lactase/phlorizin hydrolase-like [Adelges cooleyi]XP_050419803.1 lactase/phlorizin hydrolase-like [Adelges cooleyi]